MSWPISDYPMWDLGRFKPEWWGYGLIREVEGWLQRRIPLVDDVHVRDPSHEWSIQNDVYDDGPDSVMHWHHDGLSCSGDSSGYLIVWSNQATTEIHDPVTGKVYQPKPFRVLAFDNLRLEHRAPARKTQMSWCSRWFIRANATMTALVNDVPDVWALEL